MKRTTLPILASLLLLACGVAIAAPRPTSVTVQYDDGTAKALPVTEPLLGALAPFLRDTPPPPPPVTPPTPPPGPAPAGTVTLRAGEALHLDAGGAEADFDFGDGARFGKVNGYYAGHVYDVPGTYTARVTPRAGGGAYARTVRVSADARPVVPLRAWQAAFNADTIYDLGGQRVTCNLQLQVKADNVTIRNGTLTCNLIAQYPVVGVRGNRCSLVNVTIDTPFGVAQTPNKIGKRGIDWYGSDGVISGLAATNIDSLIIVRVGATRTVLRDVTTGPGQRSYGIFLDGPTYTSIYNPQMSASRNAEHNVRAMGSGKDVKSCKWVMLAGGSLAMRQMPPGFKQGGCIEFREAELATVLGTTIDVGQARTGPYGGTAANSPLVGDEICRKVIFDGVRPLNRAPIRLRPGSGPEITVRNFPGTSIVEAVDPNYPQRPVVGARWEGHCGPIVRVGVGRAIDPRTGIDAPPDVVVTPGEAPPDGLQVESPDADPDDPRPAFPTGDEPPPGVR